ncbi:LysM peptidoglycan-binding domain-containing protein [Chloroflexales bacterium ZM16-3]|nr:LysM peptidoglycan-binding domain-containing protein [Chloroflexales bacterium ZM16-3]
MPEPLVYLMLFLALLLPLLGAVALRLLDARMGERRVLIASAVVFGVAIASALALSRSDVGAIRIGDVSLLLPGTRPDTVFVLPADIPIQGNPEDAPVGPPVLPTLTPRPSATATVTATPLPSATPTDTPEPPTATPEPPTATPEPPAGGRTYTVESGDSLRSIAEQFGVSVDAILQANGLTPAQGDALRVGQELVIP